MENPPRSLGETSASVQLLTISMDVSARVCLPMTGGWPIEYPYLTRIGRGEKPWCVGRSVERRSLRNRDAADRSSVLEGMLRCIENEPKGSYRVGD